MTVHELTAELKDARRQVVADGYDMSFGEIATMYKSGELVIDPNYQRLYRWEESQRTRFVESLLLGIPIPPIFVFQRESGVWELIDGLQRVSTVLQLMGELRHPDQGLYPPLVLGGTNLLPGLAGMKWRSDNDNDESVFSTALQLEIKRARIRVEIVRKESDEDAKYEVFQRLNTGGTKLSEQEVRNSVLVMLNTQFYDWLVQLTDRAPFRATVQLTDTQRDEQQAVEIALRFVAYRQYPYQRGLDVNEYLDVAARHLVKLDGPALERERDLFDWTFNTLQQAVGDDVFKRWNGNRHLGGFSISAFDAITYGVSVNRDAIADLPDVERQEWLARRVRELWTDDVFQANSGSGVRGTTRLTNLLPYAVEFFRP
ncbi:hypothetical protein WK81_27915 [Burkholderia ubonensis]|uniref:DUF262 domain-containing protein n=1 Tax=Burkholderia ubonensis TaxID=101571 RepID=UPI00075BBC78|nr:DUF262 domain-containing protein [Burkholderia ubonensis]KVV36062.1 hypothetical protein WK81_27915 [Burkholderia ubonensis]